MPRVAAPNIDGGANAGAAEGGDDGAEMPGPPAIHNQLDRGGEPADNPPHLPHLLDHNYLGDKNYLI